MLAVATPVAAMPVVVEFPPWGPVVCPRVWVADSLVLEEELPVAVLSQELEEELPEVVPFLVLEEELPVAVLSLVLEVELPVAVELFPEPLVAVELFPEPLVAVGLFPEPPVAVELFPELEVLCPAVSSLRWDSLNWVPTVCLCPRPLLESVASVARLPQVLTTQVPSIPSRSSCRDSPPGWKTSMRLS